MIVGCLIGAATALSSTGTSPEQTCDDLHHCRSIPSIIFSCASTIFLCTWVALHPNVPHNPREPWYKRLSKRVGLTVLALLAPEGITFWALADWTDSCAALKELLGALLLLFQDFVVGKDSSYLLKKKNVPRKVSGLWVDRDACHVCVDGWIQTRERES